MKLVSQDAILVQRAYWLIKLRWIAIPFVGIATWFSSNILGVELQDYALYGVAVLLALYNTVILLLLNYYSREKSGVSRSSIKKIVNFQISADLTSLAVLLHFSGGIENPFVFYFVFHMIIASILLSVRESYYQATYAVLLLGLVLLLEYSKLIPHYCLDGFVPRCVYQDGFYVFGTFLVFASTIYMVVYMASYIAVRLKRAEQSHREANVLLLEKDRVKDEYVSRVTHDIKGHLAAIQSCLDVVVDGLVGSLNPKQADFVGRANMRTRKLTVFVKTLLKLTQLRLSDKLRADEFLLKDTILNAVTAVKIEAENKSIRLNCNIDPLVEKIAGNQLSIEELLTNLLLNAVKYTHENGEVAISAKTCREMVQIEISDNGIGIPKEELPKVFDEFYRASNAREIEKDGSGLGLSIAKHIVEQHGGEIWVESEQGRGAVFKLTLPRLD